MRSLVSSLYAESFLFSRDSHKILDCSSCPMTLTDIENFSVAPLHTTRSCSALSIDWAHGSINRLSLRGSKTCVAREFPSNSSLTTAAQFQGCNVMTINDATCAWLSLSSLFYIVSSTLLSDALLASLRHQFRCARDGVSMTELLNDCYCRGMNV